MSKTSVQTWSISIVAVSSVGCPRYHLGEVLTKDESGAMEVLQALCKLRRPVALGMGGALWLREGDMLVMEMEHTTHSETKA